MPRKAVKVVEKPLEVVTEIDLLAIETRRLRLSESRKIVKEAEAVLKQAELEVISKLKAGAVIVGNRTAVVSEEVGDCRPKWKELYVEHFSSEHGEAEATIEARAKEAYPPSVKDVLVIGVKS